MYRDDLAALRAREEAVARAIARRPHFRLRVASPCPADWNAMRGDERVRFCGLCEKNVYNLSAMTHAEVQELIREKEGKLCVRFYQRADGTVMTADCPVAKRERRRRRILMTAGAASAAGLIVAASAGFLRIERVDDMELPQPVQQLVGFPPPPISEPPRITGRPAKYVIEEKAPTVTVGGALIGHDLSPPPRPPEEPAPPSGGLVLPHRR